LNGCFFIWFEWFCHATALLKSRWKKFDLLALQV